MKKILENKKVAITAIIIIICLALASYFILQSRNSQLPNIELLNTKETRMETFKNNKQIQNFMKNSLDSEFSTIITENNICINDLYLKEPPEIKIYEKDNKRIRSLGENYYLVEELIRNGSTGTLEYYLTDENLNKIDSPANSGIYDVEFDSENRMISVAQDGEDLYTIEYYGSSTIYYYEDKDAAIDHVQFNMKEKNKSIEYTSGNTSSTSGTHFEFHSSNDDIEGTSQFNGIFETQYKGPDVQYNYYYDTNGFLVSATTNRKNNITHDCYCYDFKNGNMFIINEESINIYDLHFVLDPSRLYNLGMNDDFMKMPMYTTELTTYSFDGTSTYEYLDDDILIKYNYEKVDQISSINCTDSSINSLNEIYNYDKDDYYISSNYETTGLYIKISEITKDNLTFKINYYDISNPANNCATEKISVSFEKKTGDTDKFEFTDESGHTGNGEITWLDNKLYLSLNSTNICFNINQAEMEDCLKENFEDRINLQDNTE